MKIQLDHMIVPCREKNIAAEFLGNLFDVPWEPAKILNPDPGVPVSAMDQYRSERASAYVNDAFTVDFMETAESIPRLHYCFRVTESEFEVILERFKEKGLKFRSEAFGPVDNKVNNGFGGKRIYWEAPDGHNWELLTVSYARKR